MERTNARLTHYIPPRETWTPAEEALFEPIDPFRVPVDEARAMQLKAIKHAFAHHYTRSAFYREYCTTRGISPTDIKAYDDLYKIPLIPDLTFKQYPGGGDFARWLASVFTGDLPQVVIKGANPTYDQVLAAFIALCRAAGIKARYKSFRTCSNNDDVVSVSYVFPYFPTFNVRE